MGPVTDTPGIVTPAERARLIALVRERAAAAGEDISHMTDDQVSHWPRSQLYLFPEFIAPIRAAMESVLQDVRSVNEDIRAFEATLPRDAWWRRALGLQRWG